MKQARIRIALGLATVGTLMAGIAWYNAREAERPDGWVPVNELIAAAITTSPASSAPPQPTPAQFEPGSSAPPTQQNVPDESTDPRLSLNEATVSHLEPGSSAPPTQQNVPDEPADPRLNLNEATVSQLEQLPGIGPSKAKAIVTYREQHGRYRSIDELLEVKGIGPKILEKLSPEIYIR